MKGSEVHKLTDEELKTELARLRNDLFDMRTQSITEKVEDSSRPSKLRKDIARLLTIQRARVLGNEKAPKPRRKAPRRHRLAEKGHTKVAKKAKKTAKKVAKKTAKKASSRVRPAKKTTAKAAAPKHGARKKKVAGKKKVAKKS